LPQLQTQVRTAAPAMSFEQASAAPALSRVVYRSRAVNAFSDNDLLHLTRAAQARNHAEAITSLMLHDDGRFFQWLEGPQDGLSRIMQSISNDGRHTDIEVLNRGSVRSRTFSGWDLKLAAPGSFSTPDVIQPPPKVIEDLRRDPGHVATALARLAPSCIWPRTGSAACLVDLVQSRVLPEVAARHGLAGARAHPRTAELARLLLGTEMEPVEALVREAVHAGSRPSLRTSLFEPAARILGDMWLEDTCTEADVTLGLHWLQAAVRRLGTSRTLRCHGASQGRVLVAPVPGEVHFLGAALASDALHETGWSVTIAVPGDSDSLVEQLRSGRFDAMHLSLSDALRREHMLPLIARTVGMARSGSPNPSLRVSVGGRAFSDRSVTPADVGADARLRDTH